MLTFSLLGVVQLSQGDEKWFPRGPKARQLLSLLLMRPSQTVSLDTLVEELWDGGPPRTAVQTIRTHVYRLRTMLGREVGLPEAADLLVTEPTGYLLRVSADQGDVGRFRQLIGQGRAHLEQDDPAAAAGVLREALDLWRGSPLTDVPLGPVLAQHVAYLEEIRIRGLELWIDAGMRLGRHRELIADLRELVAAHALNEWFHARLIEALHRSGRRGDALHAVQSLRRVLHDELGVEPSDEVRRLQLAVLAQAS
ncbi:AfsR/SARP family transcriptional regulator [Planotetraspora sp. A-T 1434]|uniref:AfsR/SARP family transcriptional regulator n=1 Tax=Planotetraspora sp. A-T 1434 TaxID=2979219 RepID=UPI0021BE4A02|nr:AfsR/SARP family transcriptional regulator [Planotetraspora sp. A-T 1434]MCT9930523.1 AfsR/SARP family transcriptional regulator [Planotetraspora sp. A-T 1434]